MAVTGWCAPLDRLSMPTDAERTPETRCNGNLRMLLRIFVLYREISCLTHWVNRGGGGVRRNYGHGLIGQAKPDGINPHLALQ